MTGKQESAIAIGSRHVFEAARLETLRGCQILDTLPEKSFDDLCRLAAMVCEAPIAHIRFVDEDRLWSKARLGTQEQTLPRAGSFCDATIRAASLFIVTDASTSAAFERYPLVKDGIRFYAGAPLVMGSRPIGTLCVLDTRPRDLSEHQREALTLLAEQVVSQLELRRQVIRDPLTGLFNRRYLEESLRREIARANRDGTSVGVLMFDMDHFKEVNDTLGHALGDEVLRRLASSLRSRLRTEDIACRFGGDEFVLLMPSSSLLEAQARAEQLRAAASGELADFVAGAGGPPDVTLSAGIAAFPLNGTDAEGLLGAVDRALYTAKAHGRDCVVVADPTGIVRTRIVSVLLVDDHEDSRELYAEYLRCSAIRVETAADGLEAITRACAVLPDVIVMDLRMPRLDGFEATRRLKAEPRTRHIPVIALTGDLPAAEEEARRSGCDAFLVRPCVPERLLAEIRHLV